MIIAIGVKEMSLLVLSFHLYTKGCAAEEREEKGKKYHKGQYNASVL